MVVSRVFFTKMTLITTLLLLLLLKLFPKYIFYITCHPFSSLKKKNESSYWLILSCVTKNPIRCSQIYVTYFSGSYWSTDFLYPNSFTFNKCSQPCFSLKYHSTGPEPGHHYIIYFFPFDSCLLGPNTLLPLTLGYSGTMRKGWPFLIYFKAFSLLNFIFGVLPLNNNEFMS